MLNEKLVPLLLLMSASSVSAVPNVPREAAVSGVPDAVRAEYRLTPGWYQKYVDANGIAILGSAAVTDAALLQARKTVMRMTRTMPIATGALTRAKVTVVIFARRETASSIPEFAAAFGDRMGDRFWAGFGATATLPICGGSEANIVDRFGDEDILVHEFGHTIADMGLAVTDPTFRSRLDAAYRAAAGSGLWRNTYAGTGVSEYWAEGVQSYFSVNRKGVPDGDGIHNLIWNRAALKTYDRGLYDILAGVFGDAPL